MVTLHFRFQVADSRTLLGVLKMNLFCFFFFFFTWNYVKLKILALLSAVYSFFPPFRMIPKIIKIPAVLCGLTSKVNPPLILDFFRVGEGKLVLKVSVLTCM